MGGHVEAQLPQAVGDGGRITLSMPWSFITSSNTLSDRPPISEVSSMYSAMAASNASKACSVTIRRMPAGRSAESTFPCTRQPLHSKQPLSSIIAKHRAVTCITAVLQCGYSAAVH